MLQMVVNKFVTESLQSALLTVILLGISDP